MESSLHFELLGTSAKFQKAAVSSFVCLSVYSSVGLHAVIQLPRVGFSWYLIFEDFLKSVKKI